MNNYASIILLYVISFCSLGYGIQKDFKNPLTSPDVNWASKSISEWMNDARQSHDERVKDAFLNASGEGLREGFCPLFAKLWLGEDLDKVNDELYAIITSKDPNVRQKYRLSDHWCLVVNQQFFHMYYAFGSKGTIAKGRLYPKTEKALLAELWDRTYQKNDIVFARQSTWWMQGSENHDVVAKVSNLISSQIFMNEPDYADKVYPDLGTGGGQDYWFHQLYAGGTYNGPPGRAHFKNGKEYRAKDHYKAWAKYFDEYFRQRAGKGFFLEMASPGYMAVTITYLNDIYDLCEDKQLKATSGKFLDLIWIEWAQDSLDGIRGGAKTRTNDGARHKDSMFTFAQFYFGGKGSPQGNFFTQLLTSYSPPKIVWQIALDREDLGCFEYISRKIGEEEPKMPRPLGTERTLLCDTPSRYVRYSYVTPDYVLGTQMDHPLAVHSHLSIAARWQGLIFRDHEGARVYPCDLEIDEKGHWKDGKNGYYRSVQYKNVLITQQCRRWNQINPDWFPNQNMLNLSWGVYFGSKYDELKEQGGWIFVRKQNAYVAVRPVLAKFNKSYQILVDKTEGELWEPIIEDSYSWNPEHTFIKLLDNYEAVIMEAGRKADYGDFQKFIADVLDNPLKLQRTVVPGYNILIYKGCGKDAQEIVFNTANNEIPTIGGKYVDYEPDYVFYSPYFKSKYNSGKVWAGFNNNELKLRF